MSEASHVGGCHCGAVRFRAEGPPTRVGLCHCLTCRRHTGSAFHAYAVFPMNAVEVKGGTRGWPTPDCLRHFCPECGAPVFLLDPTTPGEIEIYLGAFDEAESLTPDYEVWTKRRLPWLPEIPGVRSFAGNRPPG